MSPAEKKQVLDAFAPLARIVAEHEARSLPKGASGVRADVFIPVGTGQEVLRLSEVSAALRILQRDALCVDEGVRQRRQP